MKTVLIAPDSFKGSLSAQEFISIVSKSLKGNYNILACPLADGGEGSIDILAGSLAIDKIEVEVYDPLFRTISTYYLFDKEHSIAYIEMAKASGITLLNNELDVMNATSFGTGELIKDAIINKQAKEIILFIGGSASNDAGLGIAEALGFKFLNNKGEQLKPIGANLSQVVRIDDSESIIKQNNTNITIAADVNNPFYGLQGAAHVYAAQKGAAKDQIIALDDGLKNINDLINDIYGINLQEIPGAGAAGGVGGGLIVFLGATLVSGSNLIFDLLNIEYKIQEADVVITGEGKIDHQTLNDKLIFKLSKLAAKNKKKTIAICGFFDGDNQLKDQLLISQIISLATNKKEIPYAIKHANDLLKKRIKQELISAI